MAGVLLIQTAFIGDVILATPLIEALFSQNPNRPIDFLLRKGNEGLLNQHPKLRKVWIWEKKGNKYQNLRKLSKGIRKQSYDYVINLHRFSSSGFITVFSGAKVTIGFNKNPLSHFFSHRISHVMQSGIHEVDRNAALLAPILGKDQDQMRPKLYPSQQDYTKIEPYIHKPYVCIAPSSVWFTKAFPQHKWIALTERIPHLWKIFLLGGPGDKENCQNILSRSTHPGISNLAGELSLLQSAALMAKASMNYVNDSAPMHLASAMNAPTTAIFCSTDPKFGFGPLSDQSFIVQNLVPPSCKPCGLHGFDKCPKEHFNCAEKIPIEEIPLPRL